MLTNFTLVIYKIAEKYYVMSGAIPMLLTSSLAIY